MSENYRYNEPLQFAEKYAALDVTEYKEYLCKTISKLIKQYTKGTIALDYGCGPGVSTLFLKDLGYEAEGVDINENVIKIAQQRDPSGKYQCIRSGEIPNGDNYYDFVFSSYVLSYVDTKEELFKICKGISRVLKKGGIFVVIVEDELKYKFKNWKLIDVEFEENECLTSGCRNKTRFRENSLIAYTWYWTDDDYHDVLTQAGFTIVNLIKPTIDNTYEEISETMEAYSRIFIVEKL